MQPEFRHPEQQLRRKALLWVSAIFFISLCSLASITPGDVYTDVARLPAALQKKTPDYPASLSNALKSFKQGVDYYNKEKYASALDALPDEKEAQATAIGDYILLYRAKAYLKLEKGEEALNCFRFLRRRHPESSVRRDAIIGEILSLLKVKNPGDALSLFDSSELEPNSDVLYYRARAFDLAGEKDKALDLYLQVYAQYPDSGFSSQAVKYLLSISPKALSGRHNFEIRLNRAENLLESGNYQSARTLLVALGRIKAPDNRSAQKRDLLRGEAEYRQGRTSTARRYLRRVTAAYPELHARAIYLEGACCRRLDKEDSFLKLRDKALKLYPKSADTEELCYSAATYYDVNYDSDGARKAYQLLYDHFPNGRHAERALWKLALFPYFAGKYREAALVFWKYLLAYPDPLSAGSAMYWMGRCYQKLGDSEHAGYLYSRAQYLANNSYYGRCARDAEAALKGTTDSPADSGIALDFAEVRRTCEEVHFPVISIPEPKGAVVPVIERARQLQEADLSDLALSELRWGIRHNPEHNETLCFLMSRIYLMKDDPNDAIRCLRRAFPDYNFRSSEALPEEVWNVFFPVRYWGIISKEAARTQVDPTLILGVIRQESGFEERARSRANARGLMQILPSTGRTLARKASVRRYSVKKLFQAETNITLGTRYLASLLQQYGKEELALAAYNAGSTRVERWLKEFGATDMAEFVEQIPFSETRGYVKKVLSNKAHYGLLTTSVNR